MKHYPLTVVQSDLFADWDSNHSMTQYNMSGYFSFDTKCIDRERLSRAFDKLLSSNPYLYNRFVRVSEAEVPALKNYDDPTRLIRQYPDTNQKIKLDYIEMDDADLETYLHHSTPPFDLFNGPQIRLTLIRTLTHDVIAYDTFQGFIDGISLRQINEDMGTLYSGGEIEPQGMRFYEMAQKLYEDFDTEQYLEDKAFYENKLKDISCYTDFCHPNVSADLRWGHTLHRQKMVSATKIDTWAVAHGCTSAALLMAVYAKALSEMSGQRTVAFYTYHHGRSSREMKKSLYGQLTVPLPVVLDIEKGERIASLMEKVKKNMMGDIRHRCCPVYHTYRNLKIKDTTGTEFLYNGHHMDFNIDYGGHQAIWDWFDFGVSMSHLEFCIYQEGSQYIFDAVCSDALYTEAQVDVFLNLYDNIVVDIITGQ